MWLSLQPISCSAKIVSRYLRPLLEFWLIPCAFVENLSQYLYRIPNIHVTQIQRRKSEAQDVRRAEVADHALCDQGLHHRIPFRVAQADLAPSLLAFAGSHQFAILAAAPLLHKFDEQVDHRLRFITHLR